MEQYWNETFIDESAKKVMKNIWTFVLSVSILVIARAAAKSWPKNVSSPLESRHGQWEEEFPPPPSLSPISYPWGNRSGLMGYLQNFSTSGFSLLKTETLKTAGNRNKTIIPTFYRFLQKGYKTYIKELHSSRLEPCLKILDYCEVVSQSQMH